MFGLANEGKIWARVEIPDRNEEGEIVLVPVRLLLRPYTRAELREQRMVGMRAHLQPVLESLDRLSSAEGEDAVRTASADVRSAIDSYEAAEIASDRDIASRVCGWRAEDVGGEAFAPDLLAALLADEARFQAIRAGLLDASRGARRKNSPPGPAGLPGPAQVGAVNGSGTTPTNGPA